MNIIKTFLPFALLLIFQGFSAQEDAVNEPIQSPDFLLESQFYPRLNTGVFEPNIKARIVFSDVHVLRSNLTFRYNSACIPIRLSQLQVIWVDVFFDLLVDLLGL